MIRVSDESKVAFRASCDLLLNSPVSYTHVFSYSERGGTAAVRLSVKISPTFKKQRSAELHELSEKKKEFFYRHFIGRELLILAKQPEAEKKFSGYTDNYLGVAFEADGVLPNRLVTVRAVDFADGSLIGQLRNTLDS